MRKQMGHKAIRHINDVERRAPVNDVSKLIIALKMRFLDFPA